MSEQNAIAAALPERLRGYQRRLADECAGKRAIIVLPTGAGKTLIAAELVKASLPALFLVPTILLVEQQSKALRSWTKLRIGEYHGDLQLPKAWDVLVSTPAAFASAQSKHSSLTWARFELVVFDEVHHVLKDHPYRKLALGLQRSPVRVLGLTASLTYAVGEAAVNNAVQRLTDELGIQHMAMASTKEMRQDGYHGNSAQADVYTVSGWPPTGVVAADERKPHKMAEVFFSRLRSGMATQLAQGIYRCVQAMKAAVLVADARFASPLHKPVKEWGLYAHGRAQGQAGTLYAVLEHWYEALRILCTSWEEGADIAITFLRMQGCHGSAPWPPAVHVEVTKFWAACPAVFPRLQQLKDALLREHTRPGFRGLLFVQQRVTTHVLEYFIQNDEELNACFRTACLYATTAAATASLSINAKQAKERVAAFAAGKVNLLVTTSVAEEGMDVPAANCSMRFDPMQTPVSLVQSRGRARKDDSSFVVLSERLDRPAHVLAAAEEQQQHIIQAFTPGAGKTESQLRVAQESRERGAAPVLEKTDAPLASLNLYCKKTKVILEETWHEGMCELVYQSVLRTVAAVGTGDRKTAKRDAALALIAKLRSA